MLRMIRPGQVHSQKGQTEKSLTKSKFKAKIFVAFFLGFSKIIF
jgi:hypothetical protein